VCPLLLGGFEYQTYEGITYNQGQLFESRKCTTLDTAACDPWDSPAATRICDWLAAALQSMLDRPGVTGRSNDLVL